MSKSIIPNDNEYCYICKKFGICAIGTDVHHMIFGQANRKLADEDGLTVHLCHSHHMALHQKGYFKEDLQQLAELTWLEYYSKTVDDWIKRYGKNYLD